MSVKIDPIPDDRAERILADPESYFAEARKQVRERVIREIEEEKTS